MAAERQIPGGPFVNEVGTAQRQIPGGPFINETVASGIAFDAASNSGYQAASSSYSWSHTCTGSNRFLAVDVSMLSAGQTVTGITYGGVALSFIGAQSTVTSFGRVEQWGLANPASGSNTIAVTLSGSIVSSSAAVSYTGAHQTSPTEAFNSAQATNVGAADATVDVTTVADNAWVHGAVATNDTAITAGQTTRNNVTGAGGSGANEDNNGPKTPAGSVTMSYTDVGAVATWAIAGYAIRPVSAAAVITHTATGALAGAGAALDGTAAHIAIHGTSGVLAGAGGAIVGTAAHIAVHGTSGALAGAGAVIDGAAARSGTVTTHTTTGALAGAGATTAGIAERIRIHTSTGTLVGAGGTIAGTAAHIKVHDTAGVLSGAGGAIAGTAARTRAHATTGALAGTGGAIAGTAAHIKVHDATGVLSGAGGVIAGTAARATAGGYPDPTDVLVGVQYGPTGADYTGTLSIVLDLETGRIVKLLARKVGLSL